MLKYYYLKRIDQDNTNEYILYDYHISEFIDTLYIVDTENQQMNDIFKYLFDNKQEEFCALLFTDEEIEEDIIGTDETILDLTDNKYQHDKKLIKLMKKYQNILFLAEYKDEYIPVIEWLSEHNQKQNRTAKLYNTISIKFLGFEIIFERFNTAKKQKTSKKYFKKSINLMFYLENKDDTPLNNYYKTYQIKNDKIYQYFCKNIISYEYKNSIYHTIDSIPENAKYLNIKSNEFNEPLDNLPPNIEQITINSRKFNQPIDNLPHALEFLHIYSNDFNQPLDLLPVTLKYLLLDCAKYSHTINNLPPTLEKLYLKSYKFNHDPNNLPSSLKNLEMALENTSAKKYDFTNLPNSLETLYITGFCDSFSTELIKIPPNLQYILFPNRILCELLEQYPHLKEFEKKSKTITNEFA